MCSSILAKIPGFRQRIIPEPRVHSRGSQARGTRLKNVALEIAPKIANVNGPLWVFTSRSRPINFIGQGSSLDDRSQTPFCKVLRFHVCDIS